MFSSRLFWRIFSTYLVLSALGAFIFVGLVSGRLQEIVIAQLKQRLHDSAVVLRADLREEFVPDLEPHADLEAKIRQLAEENKTRITLVREDGVVIGDSEHDPTTMENHRDRAELRMARTSPSGLAQRDSPTLGIPMMYYALPISANGELMGFVRLALPMESVNAQIASVQRLVWGTALIVNLVALAITYLLVGRILQPLESLTTTAQAIAQGDLKRRVPTSGDDELGVLSQAFNEMTTQLASRIEQLNRQRQELEESSKLLATVFGTMIEAVVAIDRNEQLLFANPAAESLLGLSVSDIGGRSIFETIRSPALDKLVRQVFQQGSTQELELKLPRSKSIVMLVVSPLPGNPPPGAVMVLHDVTELRRLENMRRDFVSNVSHELKTPLTSIQAYADTLLEGALNDSDHNRKFVERIIKGAERLDALIQDLLSLARIESDAQPFEIRPVSVRSIVERCARDHLTVAEAKSIQLTLEQPEQDLQVLADPGALQTILDNLTDNAINYTLKGGSVTIRYCNVGNLVRIEVADTGIGIPPEHHNRIFERFYRVDRARSREVGGTGLGLSIVKHLVQEFEGRISLTSEQGQGSVFSIDFPSHRPQ